MAEIWVDCADRLWVRERPQSALSGSPVAVRQASAPRRKRPFVGRPVPICSSVTGVTRSMVGPSIRASGLTGKDASERRKQMVSLRRRGFTLCRDRRQFRRKRIARLTDSESALTVWQAEITNPRASTPIMGRTTPRSRPKPLLGIDAHVQGPFDASRPGRSWSLSPLPPVEPHGSHRRHYPDQVLQPGSQVFSRPLQCGGL